MKKTNRLSSCSSLRLDCIVIVMSRHIRIVLHYQCKWLVSRAKRQFYACVPVLQPNVQDGSLVLSQAYAYRGTISH